MAISQMGRFFDLLGSDGIAPDPRTWSESPLSLSDTLAGSTQLTAGTPSRRPFAGSPVSGWFKPLYAQPCDGDLASCGAQCSDPSQLFSSLNILGNCLTFATAALFAGNGDIDADPPGSRSFDGTYGVPQIVNATKILGTIAQCAAASCRGPSSTSTFGNCTTALTSLGTAFEEGRFPGELEFSSLSTITHGLSRYCHYNTAVNPDIAGPGVILSQLIQAILAISSFALITLINSWARFLMLLVAKGNWKAAQNKHKKLAGTTLNTALVSATAEFQEAQVFFTLAIQIATLVTFDPATLDCVSQPCSGPDWASSLTEAMMNGELVRTLAVNSMLPVVLTQSVLHRTGMPWWFTLLGTTAVCALALVIERRTALKPSFAALFRQRKEIEPFTACGGNPALTTYCMTPLYSLKLDSLSMLVVVGYATVGILVTLQVLDLRKRAAIRPFMEQLTPVMKEILPSFVPMLGYLFRQLYLCFWWGFQLVLAGATGVHLVMLLDVSRGFAGGGGGENRWEYGQVVSSILWAPICAKYIYYNIFGVQGSIEARLARQYRVVRVAESDNDERDDMPAGESVDRIRYIDGFKPG